MNGAEVLEAGLLGEDEDDGVVAVAAAGVHGDGGRLVHHHQVLRHRDQADGGRRHRDLVPAMAGYRDICFILSVFSSGGSVPLYKWLIHSLPLLCLHIAFFVSLAAVFPRISMRGNVYRQRRRWCCQDSACAQFENELCQQARAAAAQLDHNVGQHLLQPSGSRSP